MFTTLDPAVSTCAHDGSCSHRSVWHITWSCLITLFACSWITVRPNIPSPSDTRLVIIIRRVGITMAALIAPEIIILWAMRQWYNAREIGRKERAHGWTTTHGFFMQMGGFMLYDGDTPLGPVQLEELQKLHAEGRVEWPILTESEIQDRSKGDALSKGFVILQASWFVTQCVARGVQGLVITEIELITSVFAALNFVVYLLWWNKPVDVRHSFPLQQKLKGTFSLTVVNHKPPTTTGGKHNRSVLLPLPNIAPVLRINRFNGCTHQGPYRSRPHPMRQRNLEDREIYLNRLSNLLLFNRPVSRVFQFFKTVVAPEHPNTTKDRLRVASFYATPIQSPRVSCLMSIMVSLVGTLFGGIGCIAWSFQFPSPHEQTIWRTCSLFITCAPLILAIAWNSLHQPTWLRPPGKDSLLTSHATMPEWSRTQTTSGVGLSSATPHIFITVSNHSEYDFNDHQFVGDPSFDLLASQPSPMPLSISPPLPSILRLFFLIASKTLLVSTAIIYIIARCILLVLAFATLRNLSPEALQALEWTNLVPHL